MASTDLYQVAVAFADSRTRVARRVSSLMALVRSVESVLGDIIECGSYRGGEVMAMALTTTKQIYAFDTFSANFDEIATATKPFANLSLVKGEFALTFPQFLFTRPSGYTISALFLDCDQPSKQLALDTFWHRVAPGGICVSLDSLEIVLDKRKEL